MNQKDDVDPPRYYIEPIKYRELSRRYPLRKPTRKRMMTIARMLGWQDVARALLRNGRGIR